jgi:hypothetical protein
MLCRALVLDLSSEKQSVLKSLYVELLKKVDVQITRLYCFGKGSSLELFHYLQKEYNILMPEV